jgi:hypothetical protein
MTPEAQEILEVATPRVHEILHPKRTGLDDGPPNSIIDHEAVYMKPTDRDQIDQAFKQQRATRKDKGTKRPPKQALAAQATLGSVTAEQIREIERLYAAEALAHDVHMQALGELRILSEREDKARYDRERYLASLAKGGK